MSLQNAILGILTYSPMNGYYLRKVFDESVNYAWTASLSQIYRELGILEKNGYVRSSIEEQDDRPDKKIYSITEEGKKSFVDWLTHFPEEFSFPKRDGFMLRIFFGSQLEKAELIKQFKKFIAERESFKQFMSEGKDTVKKMSKIMKTDILPWMEENELYWKFTVRRALMTNQILIDWAQECIGELEASIHEEADL
jgi:DNA-binding PadR family transcriptional regulator